MSDGNDDAPTGAELIAGFIDLLSVEEIDTDIYRGKRQPGGIGRVFGGQVIAQALAAAEQSVEADRTPHSLHAYFMRPGSEDHPIVYRVERDRDGRSFSTRRVIAQQRGKPILSAAINFQVPEDGGSHQALVMPDVPGPDDLPSRSDSMRAEIEKLPEAVRKRILRPRPIEMRPISGFLPIGGGDKGDPETQVWFRAAAPMPDDPALHRWALAYASDSNMLGAAMLPHGISWQTKGTQTASLDHSLWFHEDARVDDWLLFTTDSPWSGHARGFARGQIFTREGQLVASVAQEGLMRFLPGEA